MHETSTENKQQNFTEKHSWSKSPFYILVFLFCRHFQSPSLKIRSKKCLHYLYFFECLLTDYHNSKVIYSPSSPIYNQSSAGRRLLWHIFTVHVQSRPPVVVIISSSKGGRQETKYKEQKKAVRSKCITKTQRWHTYIVMLHNATEVMYEM